MNRLIKKPHPILFIIFLEGFVSISIEILTIRQLIPEVGTSIIATSLIIGIFLLFLAIGYWKGGLYKENFTSILRRNFIIAAGLMGVGISYPFITGFFIVIEHYTPISNMLFSLIVYLLLVISPIIYLIGQTVPLTMNLISPKKRTAEVGGKVLFISTLGSFLGALLTSLLLMEFLGVAWTVFINFLILITLALSFAKTRLGIVKNIVLFAIMAWVVYNLNISFEKDHFIITTNYANYNVSKNVQLDSGQKGNVLISNNSFSSFIGDKKENFPYIELIKHILFKDLKLQDSQILVLGAGGFTLSAKNTYGNHFTYVDIDPKIKSIVEEHFLGQINGDFVAQDARIYLAKHPKQYDVIISDVYGNALSIPPALLTREYFSNIRSSLKPEGIALFNIIAKPYLNDDYSKRVDSTIRAVFGNCMSIPLSYSTGLTNIIYVCSTAENAHDKRIYTDNHNTADFDFIFSQKANH
jgi:spermidine synthase